MKRSILTALVLCFAFSLYAQLMYVTTGGAGLKDGSSWTNALDGNSPYGNGFTKLAQATQVAKSGTQFLIAEGVYKAATDGDRNRYFLLGDGVIFSGGYAGMETSPDARSILLHKTVFSGDIGLVNDRNDNAYHIFSSNHTGVIYTSSPVIDGLVLYGGNANNQSSSFNNAGGAVFLSYGKKAVIKNCIISNNNQFREGAINALSKLTVDNCILVNNGKAAISGPVSITNSTLVNNEIGFSLGVNSYVDNCIVWGNGLVSSGNTSSIFFTNCFIQGGLHGGNGANPQFVNPSAGIGLNYDGSIADWNLSPSSPCINSGENTLIPYNTFTDCANKKRINGSRVDIGALEFGSSVNPTDLTSIPSSKPAFSLLTDSSVRITWTRGNGSVCKVWIARADQTDNVPKTNGKDFTASPSFLAGDLLPEKGMVWSCVYQGTGTQVDLSDLTAGTKYSVCIFEHFADGLAQLPATISFSTTGVESTISRIYYIKKGGGNKGHDGRSWETAFDSPQPALILSKKSDRLWIAGGTYFPTPVSSRYESFLLKEGISLYGGFAGNETALAQRIPGKNKTVLSGNIGTNADSKDNSYHVIYSAPALTPWSAPALIDNVTIREGQSDGSGDDAAGGGVFLNTNCNLKMTSCQLISNACSGSGNPNTPTYTGGGGLMNKGILQLENCDLLDNQALYLGGGLYNGNMLSLKKCTISSNKITFSGEGTFKEWGGGGIYNGLNARMVMDSCDIKNNTTQNNIHGGGIYNRGKAIVRYSLVENNLSARDGGGIYSTGVLQILNSHVSLNQSAYDGGGIHAADSLTVDRCLFDFNAAHTSPAIYTGGYGVISNSEISHSKSTGQSGIAGGINSCGKTRIFNCNIHSNDLKGIQFGTPGNIFSVVTVFNGSDGGGILHQGDSLWVDNCSIHHNVSGGGGGIAVYSGHALVRNTKITNNLSGYGAAISNKAKTQLSNCLIANNTYYSGGLFRNVGNSITTIANSTISNNRLYSELNGNAVFVHGEFQNFVPNHFKLTNCIIQSPTKIAGYYPGTTGTDSISYSCVTGGFPGTGNMNTDPKFVNPTAGNEISFDALLADWTLLPNSPCINAGADAYCTDVTDLGGNQRKNARIDIGAYELKSSNPNLNTGFENTVSVFSIYPNPVKNELNLEQNGTNEKTTFEILNLKGQLVFIGMLMDKTLVQTTSFSPGMYVIRFVNGNSVESMKFIKE